MYLVYRVGPGLADGKIAVGLAGIAPPALVAGAIVQGLVFLYARLRTRQAVRLPGAVGFYLGAVIATSVLTISWRLPNANSSWCGLMAVDQFGRSLAPITSRIKMTPPITTPVTIPIASANTGANRQQEVTMSWQL